MSRRISLPGADELFRSTTNLAAVPAVAAVPDLPAMPAAENVGATEEPLNVTRKPVRTTSRRRSNNIDRSASGRERHDEKITVYISPEELYDLDQARLTLRGDLGLAVDRGRIVREALHIVIADLEAKGDASILARRLRGR